MIRVPGGNMSSHSRATWLLRIIRRHASTTTSTAIPSSSFAKAKSTSRLPPRANPPRVVESKSRGPDPIENPSETSQPSHGAFRRLLSHPEFRILRLIVFISPGIFLAMMHSPYGLWSVTGSSMSPLFNPESPDELPKSDKVLVHYIYPELTERNAARAEAGVGESHKDNFHRGQIVLFRTPHEPEKLAVKRIVAVAGDLVQPLPDYSGGASPVVIPWNHVWVEGDVGDRKKSIDSNWYGPISQNLLLGEVTAASRSYTRGWTWVNQNHHTWPARQQERVNENAIMEATVDPDSVNYNSGWTDGSIALVLERMRTQPEQVLFTFVNDNKIRQETRRLYNNALYVSDIATSEQEKQLAADLLQEMEEVYGREALIYGIAIKRRVRDRGELPDTGNSKIGENKVKDAAATDAEKWLKKQGWELEKNVDGSVRTRQTTSI